MFDKKYDIGEIGFMTEFKNQLLTDDVKELLTKHQLEWVNNGDKWSKGFVQGVEYMLRKNGENLEDVCK